MAVNNPYVWGTGRRKTATARVRIKAGTGKFLINDRPVDQFFVTEETRRLALQPLVVTEARNIYDIWVNVDGGGPTGQAGAVRMGIARALCELDGDLRDPLKKAGFLTRDAREKESKKYGLKKARKAPQYSKR